MRHATSTPAPADSKFVKGSDPVQEGSRIRLETEDRLLDADVWSRPSLVNQMITYVDLGHISKTYSLELAQPFRVGFRALLFG
jgi:hypothetical protein